MAQEFTEHLIDNNYNSWSTMAIDMDNDDDIDIVGSSRFGNKVAWWENDGSENFTEHIISNTAWYAMGVSAADMDADEDIDVVCAAQEANAVLWWENDGNQNFVQHNASTIVSPSYIYLTDVDSDEDMDILVAACEDNSNKILWLENTGQYSFTTYIIKENWDHANSVYAADMDSDGDMDILGTASFRTAPANGEITWFENDGDQNFTEINIINNYGRPSCAIATDIDNDGDTDVIASVCILHRIILLENDGLQNFTTSNVTTSFFRPHSVFASDMDNDGDKDILGAAINANQIAWFENENNSFIKHIISSTFEGATCVYAKDIDSDGDQDVLGAAQFNDQIAWWESDLITSIADQLSLFSNDNVSFSCYPNPFNEQTSIHLNLVKEDVISVNILSSSGSELKSLLSKRLIKGEYTVTWDGSDQYNNHLPPGTYFVEFITKNLQSNRIVKLIKY